jgi:hypothetical protein
MADPKDEGIQNPGSGSPEPISSRSASARDKPNKKYEKDKASEHPECQDLEFEPSDISREQQASSICLAD